MADKPSLLNLDQAQNELQNIQGKMSNQISNFESQTIQQTKNVINEIDKQIKTLQNSVSSQDIMGPLKKQLDETMAMFKQFQEIGNRAIATQKYEVETFTNNVSKMYEAIKKSQEAVQQFNSTSIGNVQQINEFEQSINSLKSSFESFISTSDIINIEQADLDAIRQRMMNFVSDLNSECSKAFNIADILTQTSQDPNIKSAIVNMLAPLNEAITQIPDNVMNSFAKIQSNQNGTSNNAIQDLINSLNSFSETIKAETSDRVPVQTPIVITSESDNKVSNTSDNSDTNVVSKLNDYFDKMFANTNVDKNTTDVSGLVNLEDVQNEIQGIQDEMSNQISNFESQTIQQTKNVINDIGTQVQVLQDVLLSQDIVDPLKTQIDETIEMFENFQLVGNNVIASQQSEVAEFTSNVSKIYEAIKKSQEAVQQFNETSIGDVQKVNEFEESITNLYNSFEGFISVNDIVNIEQADLDNIRQNIMSFMNTLNDECSKALNIADAVVNTSNDPNIQSVLVNMLSPLNEVITQIPDNVINSFAKIDNSISNNAIQDLIKSMSNINITDVLDSNILDKTSTEQNKQYIANTKNETVDNSIDISDFLNFDDIESNIQSIQDEIYSQISNLESKTIKETKDIISNIDKQIQELQNNVSFEDIADPLKVQLDETITLFENFKEVGNNAITSQKAEMATFIDNVSKIYEAIEQSQDVIQQFNSTPIGNIQQVNEFEKNISDLKSSFEDFISANDIVDIEQIDLDTIKQQFASFIQDLNDECSKTLNFADILAQVGNDPNIRAILVNMLSPLNEVITQIPNDIINVFAGIDTASNNAIQGLINSLNEVSNISQSEILNTDIVVYDTIPTGESNRQVSNSDIDTGTTPKTIADSTNEYSDNNISNIFDLLHFTDIENNIKNIQDQMSNEVSKFESQSIEQTKVVIQDVSKQIQTLQDQLLSNNIAMSFDSQLGDIIDMFTDLQAIGNKVIAEQTREVESFANNIAKIYEAIKQSHEAAQQFSETSIGNEKQVKDFEQGIINVKNSLEDFIATNDIINIKQTDLDVIRQGIMSFMKDLNIECSNALDIASSIIRASEDPNIKSALLNMLSPLNNAITQIPDDVINSFAKIHTNNVSNKNELTSDDNVVSTNYIHELTNSVNSLADIVGTQTSKPETSKTEVAIYDQELAEENSKKRLADNTKAVDDAEKATVDRLSEHFNRIFSSEHYASNVDTNINKMEGDSLKLDLKIDKLIEAFDKYSEADLAKLSKLGIDSNNVSTLKDDAGDIQRLLFNYKMKSDGAEKAVDNYETAGKNYTRNSSPENLLKLIESEKKVKEEAKNAADALDELMGFANKYIATLDIDTKTLQQLPDEMKEVLISMNDIFTVNLQSGKDLLKLYEAFGINIDNIGDNLKKSMRDAKDSITEINEEIESLNVGSSSGGGKLSKIFNGIGTAISGTAKGVGGYYDLLDKVGINPGIPTDTNGILRHIRAGTEWYQKFGQMNYDGAIAQLAQGGPIDEHRLAQYKDTGKELYRMSYGQITNEDYYNKTTQLLTQVQGHYGEGHNKEQGRQDLESMSKMAVMIEEVYGVDSVNTINTFYKELGMSTEETNTLLSKLVNTAEMANIPVSQYVKTISELSLKFRDLGVDVKIAENGMRTLTMEGMSFSTAQGLTSGMGNAINRFTDNPGQMAVFGMLSGQFSDPWEAMWKMSDRWDENGNVKPDATKSIIAAIGTQMDYIAKMSGGNEYAQRGMIRQALKDMFAFDSEQATILTNKYMSGAASGDYTSFEEMFEKYFLQGEEGSNTIEKDLQDKIIAATNQLDELTKAEAIVTASQQDLADSLEHFYDTVLKDMRGSIDTLNGSINELVSKFTSSPIGDGLAHSLNWLGPLIGGATGLLSSLFGGRMLKAGVDKLLGKKPKKLKKSKKGSTKTTADKADDAVKSAINNTNDTAKTVANSTDDITKSAINGTDDIAKDIVNGADDVAKTIANSADDATKTIANSADDVVKTVINGTDDATKTVANGADDAVKLMASNADDVTKIAINGADDAVKVIANGADDAIKIVADGADDIIKTTAGGVLKTVLGTASKIATPLATLLSGVFTFKDSKKEGKSNGQALMEAGGSAVGSGLGGWAGASSGAAAGSIFGPWGTVIGALIGGFAGGFGGDKLGKGAGEYLYNIFAEDEKKAKTTSSTTALNGLTSSEKLLKDVENTMKNGQTQSSKDSKDQLTVLTTISDETNNTMQNIDSLIGRAESIEKAIKKMSSSVLKVLRTDGVKIKASSLSKLSGGGSGSGSGSGSTTFGSNFNTTARDELTNALNNYKNDKNNNTGSSIMNTGSGSSIMNTGSGNSIMNTGSGSSGGTGSSLFGSNFNTTAKDELMNALNNHKNDKNNNKNNTSGAKSKNWSPADIAKLTVNDVIHKDLTQKTNLTAQDINNWIASKTKSNSKMRGMGEAFLAASKESGLDPLYLVAHAALETGWGTSNILNKKNNWFGIGAFDASPYESAYGFSNLEAGIIEGAKWISKYYTKDGQETLWKMVHDPDGDHNYATDPEWAKKIASIMITGAGGNGSYSPSDNSSSDNSGSSDDSTENTKTFEELVKENTFGSTIFNIGSPEWSNKKASYDVNKYKDYDFGEKSSYVFRDSQAIARKAYLSYNENDVYKSTIQAYDDRRSAYNQNPQFNININVAGENGKYEAMAKEMKTALSNIALQHMGNSARISSANYYRANSQF